MHKECNIYRKIKKSEASTESDMMKQMLDSSSEDNNQRPAQHMQMNYSQPIVNNQYDKTYNLQNMQVPNYNPQTNATMPNLTNDGSMPIQPITGQNVMQQMVNNPNPNMFNMDNANQSNGLPPKPDKVDPLMMNHIAPVVTQDKVLSYLKQLNAIYDLRGAINVLPVINQHCVLEITSFNIESTTGQMTLIVGTPMVLTGLGEEIGNKFQFVEFFLH